MDQDAATPRRPGAVEPFIETRCEACLAFRDDPVHQPVFGAGFFATAIADQTLPWQPNWIHPHHPFRQPPPSTASKVAGAIVAHELDLEPVRQESNQPGWATETLSKIAAETEEHYPGDPEIDRADDRPGHMGRRRIATWLTSMFLFLGVAAVASASTQQDVVAVEERIAAVETARIEAAFQLEEARHRLVEARALVARLTEDAATTDREALRSAQQARRSAGAVYPDAFGASAAFQTALNAESVQDAAVAAAYSTAVAEHDQASAVTAAADATEAQAELVSATVSVAAQHAIIRDLQVRILELDRQIANARVELNEVRRAAQRRLGINDDTERWRPLVAKYFPEEVVDDALWVMWCESRGDPEARAFPRSSAVGLFQFIDGTWRTIAPRAGLAGAERTDPEANVAAAAWLWEFSGGTRYPTGAWGPWSCRP